jgi:hypothetical protein
MEALKNVDWQEERRKRDVVRICLRGWADAV